MKDLFQLAPGICVHLSVASNDVQRFKQRDRFFGLLAWPTRGPSSFLITRFSPIAMLLILQIGQFFARRHSVCVIVMRAFISRDSCLLTVLHCTAVSQQSVALGQTRPISGIPAMSASARRRPNHCIAPSDAQESAQMPRQSVQRKMQTPAKLGVAIRARSSPPLRRTWPFK
jgi:hypothetical protein